MIKEIMAVGLGSCVGGIARYVVSRIVQTASGSLFPWGTFTVNVTGCFIIGILYGLLDRHVAISDGMRLFLTVGFCGGFTTFSTFMHENTLLFGARNLTMVAAYASLSLFAGFLCLYAGRFLAKI